jgi:DNA-binding LytR/AlgR family response regulator
VGIIREMVVKTKPIPIQRNILKNRKLLFLKKLLFFSTFILRILSAKKIKILLPKFFFGMEKFKYIIVDDDYPSQLAVLHHLNKLPNYRCVATFYSPMEALIFLQDQKIDLIFLDIEMQEMSGFKFLETFNKNIFVIFLTAYPKKYSEAAHQYYFDKDFIAFCNKAQFSFFLPKLIAYFEKLYQEKEILERINKLYKNEVHTFPKTINGSPVLLSDIVFIQIIGHHCILNLKNREEFICRMTMNELINILPGHIFFQIARSIVINIVHTTAFTDSTVCIVDKHFSISKVNRKRVIRALQTYKEELYKVYD